MKRLPAFCLLHVGMEVRLTTTLEIHYAIQDATATVLEIQVADNDAQAQQCRRRAAALESLQPEVLLELLPVVVLVKLRDCKHAFLPVQACSDCPVFTKTCSACLAKQRKLEGVFAVTPMPRTWKYDGPELGGRYINVK